MIDARIEEIDWTRVAAELDERGHAVVERFLAPAECGALVALYADDAHFRSHVVMDRHGYGRGEYKYFAYPLPDLVRGMRTALYPQLAPIANRWQTVMSRDVSFPSEHADFIARCHAAGQLRPTPLLLKYGPDDYNRLHQDLW